MISIIRKLINKDCAVYILKYNYMSSAVLLYTKYTAITFSHSYDYYD